jgi:hypothetical protein
MIELEHKEDLIATLRNAAKVLNEASRLATVTEDDKPGLYGTYAFLIGGLSETVNELAAVIDGEL